MGGRTGVCGSSVCVLERLRSGRVLYMLCVYFHSTCVAVKCVKIRVCVHDAMRPRVGHAFGMGGVGERSACIAWSEWTFCDVVGVWAVRG